MVDYSKTTDNMEIVGGAMDGEFYDANGVTEKDFVLARTIEDIIESEF